MVVSDYPDLLKYWDYERNADLGLTPETTKITNISKAWWKCDKGHSYFGSIKNKIGKKEFYCPICKNTQLVVGVNDFATLYPEAALDWDYEQNITKPTDYAGAGKTVIYWKCHRCGHRWKSSLDARTKHGCKHCSQIDAQRYIRDSKIKTIGSLESKYPVIARMWDYKANKELLPSQVLAGSSKIVHWVGECGHHWEKAINQFVKNPKCPYCNNQKVLPGFNDLKTKYPEIAIEWDYSKNETTPDKVLYCSSSRVWWKCQKCGYEWQAEIWQRTKTKSKCVACAHREAGIKSRENALSKNGSLASSFPDLLSEWCYEKNDISPENITPFSDISVWWKCKKCGRIWKTSVRNRTRLNSSCPTCNRMGTSFPEQAVYYYCQREFGTVFNRYEGFKTDGVSELDIWIPEINTAIEYDGSYYHRSRKGDLIKDKACQKLGIRLIRIKEIDHRYKNGNENELSYHYQANNYHDFEELLIKLFTVFLDVKIQPESINIERDRNDILALFYSNQLEESLATLYPEVCLDWDYARNGSLDPHNFYAHSGIKVWWKCHICGNEWTTTIASRTAGTGCNKCKSIKAGEKHIKTLISKEGSLADRNPILASQWNYELNGEKKPSDFTVSSGERVWWHCDICGGNWKAQIASRNSGVGCPYCSGNKTLPGFNDLKTKKPDIAKDWDYTKNQITPENVSPNSSAMIYWKCSFCGYEWKQRVYNNKFGCPKCRKTSRSFPGKE